MVAYYLLRIEGINKVEPKFWVLLTKVLVVPTTQITTTKNFVAANHLVINKGLETSPSLSVVLGDSCERQREVSANRLDRA